MKNRVHQYIRHTEFNQNVMLRRDLFQTQGNIKFQNRVCSQRPCWRGNPIKRWKYFFYSFTSPTWLLRTHSVASALVAKKCIGGRGEGGAVCAHPKAIHFFVKVRSIYTIYSRTLWTSRFAKFCIAKLFMEPVIWILKNVGQLTRIRWAISLKRNNLPLNVFLFSHIP